MQKQENVIQNYQNPNVCATGQETEEGQNLVVVKNTIVPDNHQVLTFFIFLSNCTHIWILIILDDI
jgi:hypothetical protein